MPLHSLHFALDIDGRTLEWLSSLTPSSVKEGQSIERVAWKDCRLSFWLLAFSALDAIMLTTVAVALSVGVLHWALDPCWKSRREFTDANLEDGESEGLSSLELTYKGKSTEDERERERKDEP